jgi:hypothetical protein
MGAESGPDVYGRVPDRQTIPASGPERKAGLLPCPTKLTGRKCGKRVAHKYPDGWRCIGCGCLREVSSD